MAGFAYNGIDRLEADYSKLAQLGDEDRWGLLEAGANVIKEFQQKYILKLFNQRTGRLYDSIKVFKKINGNGIYALIYPSGKRTGGDRKNKTNAEVGYVLEYGSSRIKARHWMESANEAAGDDMENAMAQVWDDYLTKLNL